MEQARRDIEQETRRAIQEIRNEVADLTVLATEKVTRKTLTEDDQQRLVEEALGELDFSALAGEERTTRWRRSPRSTRARCSRSPRSRTSSTRSASSSAQFADALDESRELSVFFFSPYFSTEEKKDGLEKARRRAPTSRS